MRAHPPALPGLRRSRTSRPTLDALRLIKSPRELDVIRKSTRLSGLALVESMRSTRPGQYERELDAVGKFVFYRNGAQGDAYYSLIGSGKNAYWPHYNAGKRQMLDGDFLLMDYAPDYGYYMADVTRMFPVNGKFSDLAARALRLLPRLLPRDPEGARAGQDRAPRSSSRPAPRWTRSSPQRSSRSPRTARPPRTSSRSTRRAGERVSVHRPLGRDGDPRRRVARGPAQARHGLHHRARADGSRREDLRPPRGHGLHHTRRAPRSSRPRPRGTSTRSRS